MKNFIFKKILLPVLLVFIVFSLAYLNFNSTSKNNQVENLSDQGVITQNLSEIENNKNINQSIKEETEIKQTSDFVTLSVLDRKYQTGFIVGNTVFDVMNKIKKENNFDFKYKEYPSLGVFVNEINGVGSKDGKYWIYYVNDKEAEVGISKYVLKEGDLISWRLE